jgi:hypothetical protein
MKKWLNELNRTFSKEEVRMVKKHMKESSAPWATEEVQIKFRVRFHLT